MKGRRITKHPILAPKEDDEIEFLFNGRTLKAKRNEVISSALFAAGIHTFRKHHRDGAPQGIYCANGQCGQCLVLADGIPVKACITPVTLGMDVRSLEGLPELPADDEPKRPSDVPRIDCDVLIVGAGPSGLAAAAELAAADIRIIIADDKQRTGGKLSLQTHNFFGSISDCYAGFRGIEIARFLEEELILRKNVEFWLNSPVVGVFSDGLAGVVREGIYHLVQPDYLLVSAGAREKTLAFSGCDLPGVYGAGAFQTLVNRDMVRSAEKLFIVGAGNVGLIAAYHALQAGIEVVGIVEAMPHIGGYNVHLDKILRLGVPVYLSHSVIAAEGADHVESIVISQVDENFKPIAGTQKRFHVDTLLIAVGLAPVAELAEKARQFGLKTYSAGDSKEIAEASAAMFSGRITAREILRDMGHDIEVPKAWYDMLDVLKSKPGGVHEKKPFDTGLSQYPVIRCTQEIPCNPCQDVCPVGSIAMPTGKITEPPEFSDTCIACNRCISICPGLAITLVDRGYDASGETALVLVPWEMPEGTIRQGMDVTTSGFKGDVVGRGRVVAIRSSHWQNRRSLVALEVPASEADDVAGIRIAKTTKGQDVQGLDMDADDTIICRCERVTRKEIVDRIRAGARDFNAVKAATRICMGECGGKTCKQLIWQIFRQEGIELSEVTGHRERPFVQEVHISAFLGDDDG
jgi:NADPH-dependent 2,4-dienoyl-CoA reductase/sulfur reductase-like enzyme/ferredoxin